MNVLVTSGGTIEKIDNVRSISNMSTGKLGSTIADSFLNTTGVDKVFYICTKTTVLPTFENAEIIYANSVADLEDAIRELLSHTQIDIIIHCMAVSDYTVKSVTTLSALLEKSANSESSANEKINFDSNANTGGKISSELDDMVLLMERTPKIISLFQKLSPKSTLVGFKLLDNVPLETLIDKGFGVLTKNKCSFVLANDLKDITKDGHIGYLIDKDKNFTKYKTKAEIADAIVSATIQ